MKKKVLIVEDDFILALVNKKYLEKLGWVVTGSVITGADAIKAVKKEQPDLILMDIRIEGDMDGIEAMKNISAIADIPVIYITGNSESKVLERARKTNMKGFLIKPLHIEDLKNALENL